MTIAPDKTKTDIGLEQLANVSGGGSNNTQLAKHCATGSHFKEVGLAAGDSGGSGGSSSSTTNAWQAWMHNYFGH